MLNFKKIFFLVTIGLFGFNCFSMDYEPQNDMIMDMCHNNVDSFVAQFKPAQKIKKKFKKILKQIAKQEDRELIQELNTLRDRISHMWGNEYSDCIQENERDEPIMNSSLDKIMYIFIEYINSFIDEYCTKIHIQKIRLSFNKAYSPMQQHTFHNYCSRDFTKKIKRKKLKT